MANTRCTTLKALVLATKLLLGSAVLISWGCAQAPVKQAAAIVEEPSLNLDAPELFGTPIATISEDELFALTDEQKRAFDKFLGHFMRQDTPPHEKVFDYLEKSTRQFDYRAKTYTAAETLENLQGNCMSLAVLTTALAHHAAVDIRYQLVDSSPVFYKDSDVVVKGLHVRSKLYQRPSASGGQYYTRSSLVVDYLPDDKTRFIGNISKNQFMALYFGNRAVEFLAQEKLAEAYWHTRRALEYVPDDAANLNTLAVLFKRAGSVERAEEVYQYGIARSADKLTLLKNYRLMLQAEGREQEAAAVAKQMAAFDDPSPFGWLDAANVAFNAGDYQEAEMFYRKSIKAAPYLDYGYFGVAKVKFHQGQLLDAKDMLEKAMENTFKEEGRSLYRAKLNALERLL